MFGLDQFWVLAGILLVAVGGIWIYRVYNTRRYPNATEGDKAMWSIYGCCLFIGISILAMKGFLSVEVYPALIQKDDSQETKIEKLVERDEANAREMNRVISATQFISLAVVLALLGIGTAVSKFQTERNKQLLYDNPDTKTPLGL